MRPTTRAPRARPRALLLATLSLGTALGACFNPPAAAVMFSCPESAPACPDGYTCESDRCCHRTGSDVDANYGGCGLGDPGTAGPTTDTPTTDASSSGTSTTSSSSPSTTSSSSSTTASTTDPGTTGTTAPGTTGDTTASSTGDSDGSSSTGTT